MIAGPLFSRFRAPATASANCLDAHDDSYLPLSCSSPNFAHNAGQALNVCLTNNTEGVAIIICSAEYSIAIARSFYQAIISIQTL